MKGQLHRLGIAADAPYSGPTLLSSFARWVRETPDAPFLIDEHHRLSFADFDRWTARLAGALRARGIGVGDRVVLYLADKLEHIAAYFAAMRVGAIAVHLYPERPWSSVAFAVDHTDAALVVTARAPDEALSCPTWSPFSPSARHEADPVLTPHELAYIMFTSGTTAAPKAVLTTQANLLAVTGALIDAAGMRHGDRELIFMPLGSTGGAGHLHAAAMLGNCVRVLPWFMADVGHAELQQLVRIIEEHRIDGFLATPRLVTELLRDHREGWARAGARLRYLLANVTPMRQEVVADLLETLPQLRFVTYYGMTEASRSVMHCTRLSPGWEHATGYPTPGVEVRIAAPDSRTGVGEILLRGPNVVPGYWGGESATDAHGWLHTGDLGRVDEHGRHWALGRIKDMINVDGLKCRPPEIEAVIRDHPAVAACAVVALPDPVSYHRIGAGVVLHPDADPQGVSEALLSACATRLARYKVPQVLQVLPALPQTDLGKLKRKDLVHVLLGAEAQTSASGVRA